MEHHQGTNPCAIPISFFANVKTVRPDNQSLSWAQLKDLLRQSAQIEFPDKESAPLLSPTKFDGKRCKENATTSGVIAIDCDHGLLFADAVKTLTMCGLEAVLYTTASNRSGDRFRIIVPLSEQIDPETYKEVVRAICRLVGGPDWQPDIGKIGPYNLFYLPGNYAEADNQFEVIAGLILSADDWLELSPPYDTLPQEVPASAPAKATLSGKTAKSVKATWTTLTECPFVRGSWVDEYLSLGSGQWHRGLYTFMVRVAMSARAQGAALTAGQLADLARKLDHLDGNHYLDRDLDREAENALAWAETHAASQKSRPASLNDFLDFADEPNEFDPSDRKDCPDDAGDEGRSIACAPAYGETILDNGLPKIVPLSGVTPYAFEDQLFSGRDGAQPQAAFEFLARRCVALGDSYWIQSGSCWEPHTKATARAALIQQFLSVNTTPTITAADIRNFLGDGIVRFHGTGVFPGSPQFVWFQGRRYLNVWVDERIAPEIDHVCSAEILLRIIRENLCGLDPISMEEMILECNGEPPTIFQWVMHWLASIYLRPGHHIGVALWFLGPNMGIGKGTIIGVIRKLLGAQWVGKASTEEMSRGWTDFLAGKLVVEADEFEVGTRTALNRLYKQWLGNEILELSKRHVGSFTIPNCLNHIMTTNEIHPIQLDRNDRRHTIIHTSDDRSRNALATAFHKLGKEEKLAAIQGLAAILAAINIDDDLISKPFPTEHRAALISWSASAVERWFAAKDACWAIGDRRNAQELYQDFLSWAESHDRRAKDCISNAVSFGKEMTKLTAANYATKVKSSGIAYIKIAYYDPATEQVVAAKKEQDAQTDQIKERMTANGYLPAKPNLDDLFK